MIGVLLPECGQICWDQHHSWDSSDSTTIRIDEHFGAKGVERNAKQIAIPHLSLKGKPKTIFRSLRRLSQQASKLLNPYLAPHLNPHLNPQNQLFNSIKSPLIDANAMMKQHFKSLSGRLVTVSSTVGCCFLPTSRKLLNRTS